MKFPFKQEIEVRSTGRNRLLYSDKFFDTEIVKDVNGYSSSGCGAQNVKRNSLSEKLKTDYLFCIL